MFSVAWNGVTLTNLATVTYPTWTNLTFEVIAASTSTPLQIGFRDDPNYLDLDDVSVQPLQPVIQSALKGPGGVTLTWSALLGQSYQVQSTTNLSKPNWQPASGVFMATNYLMSAIPFTGTNSPTFFRVELLQ